LNSLAIAFCYSEDQFALTDDGNGATEITLGVPSPTREILVDLSNAVYTNSDTNREAEKSIAQLRTLKIKT
jgi:hypothetical protein